MNIEFSGQSPEKIHRHENRVGEVLAKGVSLLLHPLAMPTYGAAVMLYGPTYLTILPPHLKLFILTVFALTTLLLPLFSINLLHYLKVVPDLSPDRQRNLLPTLVVIASYAICNYLIRSYIAIGLLPYLLLGGIGIALVCFAVNFRWRISRHAAAIGGLTALMFCITGQGYGQMTTISLILILLSGLLGTARLYLGRNHIRQVLAGFMIGIGVIVLITSIL